MLKTITIEAMQDRVVLLHCGGDFRMGLTITSIDPLAYEEPASWRSSLLMALRTAGHHRTLNWLIEQAVAGHKVGMEFNLAAWGWKVGAHTAKRAAHQATINQLVHMMTIDERRLENLANDSAGLIGVISPWRMDWNRAFAEGYRAALAFELDAAVDESDCYAAKIRYFKDKPV